MKSSLIVSLIALFSIIFLSSCNNKQNQKCNLPDLYLEGDSGVYVDSTANYVTKTKKVVRYNSSCDSDSVVVKYLVKKDVTAKEFGFKSQGKKANLDSLLAAQKCGMGIVGPAVIDNGGGNDSNGGFSGIPNWLKNLLWILFALLLLLAVLWLLRQLGEALFAPRRPYQPNPPAYRVDQPAPVAPVQQPTQQQPIAPVTTGNPQIQSTCISGVTPGAIVIPPALANLEEETISITRRYFRPTA